MGSRRGEGPLRSYVARRLPRIVLATVLVVAAQLPAAGAQATPCALKRVNTPLGTWTRIPTPPLRIPPVNDELNYNEQPTSHLFAVDRIDPAHMYVVEDTSVYETTDGGCTWRDSNMFETPLSAAGLGGNYRIASLATPASARAPTAYALLSQAQPMLARTDRGAHDWRVTPLTDTSGASIMGGPLRLWVAPSDPHVLYATISSDGAETLGDVIRLYRSDDGGDSWTLALANPSTLYSGGSSPIWWITDAACPRQPDTCVFVDPRVMEIDPLDAHKLWTATSNGVFSSDDGGHSWANVYPVTEGSLGTIAEIDVSHPMGEASRIAVFGSFGTAWSNDGGRTWDLRDEVPGYDSTGQRGIASTVESVASAGPGELVAVLGWSSSFAHSNVEVMRETRWERTAPPWLDCPIPNVGDRECLTQIDFVPAAGAYFTIRRDGRELVAFRPRSRR